MHYVIVLTAIKPVLFESDITRTNSIYMHKKIHLWCWLTLLTVLACFGAAKSANAMTAEQYFADGNRLFRDDLYWAALLRYRQAADEGMRSSLLHYNTGIAHYRASQHARAHEALLKALEDPGLRIVAHYNLGLNAYEMGDTNGALRWFRLARDQGQNEKIRTFAIIAISRLRDERARPEAFDTRVAERAKKRDFTSLSLHARVSFGSDSNVFRSPDRAYIDFSDPVLPIIVPQERSGVFLPVSLAARYKINSFNFEGFFVAYRLTGRYYQDKDLDNANEYQHEASFGSEYRREEDGRERRVYSAFKVAQHDETYYDPDNGLARNVSGVDIDDRMDYLRYGPEITFRQSYQRLSFGAHITGQLWNYKEQLVVPEYDHEYFLVSLFGQYKFAPSSLLRLTMKGYSRRFGDRPSYDLDGQQRLGNPGVRYDYLSLSLTARQRIFGSVWFGFDIEHTKRTDQYAGYNDYTRDSFGVEVHWAPGDRFNLEASGNYRLYNYPNAFAFHNPLAGNKTQEAAKISLTGSYQMTHNLSLVGEARFRETVSNDLRIQYERTQYIIGVRWDH